MPESKRLFAIPIASVPLAEGYFVFERGEGYDSSAFVKIYELIGKNAPVGHV